MRSSTALLLVLSITAACPVRALAQRDTPLRVVRVTPGSDPTPLSRITVTFDRPVAGSLDRTVDATTILRVLPAIPGKIEWRDPVTIRLTPSALLAPGTQYTVTVANNFRAMDGSALAEPYGFTFRVRGPTLLTGFPVGPPDTGQRAYAGVPRAEHVVPNQKFELVYSTPVDLRKLSAASFVELNATCGGQRIVKLVAESQRRIRKGDRNSIEQAGGWDRDRSADSLRRVVLLTPQTALPHGCVADLVAPVEVEDPSTHGVARFNFATYGDLRLGVAACARGTTECPTGPIVVNFTNPVRGAEVVRRLHLLPQTKFTVRDTSAESTEWTLEATLKPRTGYAVVADTAMRDVFGQSLTGNPAAGMRTTGYTPSITHAFGRLLVERVGAHTLAVQHVNVDTLIATIVPVPDSLEARVLNKFAWGGDTLWNSLVRTANVVRIPVRNVLDRPTITGVRIPTLNAMRAGTPALFAVKISGRAAGTTARTEGAPALIQVTDLGVHAKIGVNDGAVWVTGVSDGKPKGGATVVLFDAQGRRVATTRTNAEGIARFERFVDPTPSDTTDDDEDDRTNFEGYVSVTLGTDRAITAINRYDPDLSPYRFNVYSAWGDTRLPVAGAMFTERGIYRPGERVYAKAIVRNGTLGALRAPAPGDSINWQFHDRDEGMLREVTTTLSSFGTADQSVVLPASAGVGEYRAEIRVKRQGKWRSIAGTNYRVAEYRPPEFLVDVTAPTANRMPGDKFAATAEARYLFGAPMGRAVVQWSAQQTPVYWWDFDIPNTEGAYVGESGSWWEDNQDDRTDVFQSRTDTLDARGTRTFSVTLPATPKGRASRVTIEATVTDINRQTVSSRTTTLVHPAEFYIAAKPTGDDYFWKTNAPQSIAITTVRPDGQKITGIRVDGTIARREWHRVRLERNGYSQVVGEWVTDTIARCAVTSATSSASCNFSAKEGGMYIVSFTAKDAKGHAVRTSFYRWAAGAGWVPWSDETQFKMDVIPDKARYSVGDTATVLFASPFTNAEAWITIEREGLIEQRRIHITSGSTTLKLPITEAFAPNVFVSILVARGRSAPPGTLDDAGKPTIRVGYAELRVIPEVKRLTVTVAAERSEYRPADSARVRIQVRDAQGRGQRSEVTLWAVDEGVLSLTGYKTPDPLELIYQERGLGMRLASNMTTVAPQIPEGEKGQRDPGGGGGAAGADVLRSRFQTTAFFLGTVVTDALGNVVAGAKLPDNITTFRLMAVAVTNADRYGKGQSNMLVTRPLLARQALPRFVRPGDQFTAGAVINRRDGSSVNVKVKAASTGATLRGDAEQSVTLAAQRGSEVRFPFLATRTDSASFRFDVTDNTNADAVRVTIPVRPDHHPVTHTLAGVVYDTMSTVELALPQGMDLDRSRLSLSVGVSPLATIRGIQRTLRIYPYECTEQVTSAAIPLIALYRAQMQGGADKMKGDPRREIARAVAIV
ncbi:MAG: Ig-like domain-containing protein, partial [Gemmatimonadaceae bacterium]